MRSLRRSTLSVSPQHYIGMPPKPTPEQLALRGFVQRLEQNIDDTEAWLGYAKLLSAKRDARGEAIVRWHEKRGFDAYVAQRSGDLFGEYASDVGPDKLFRPTWYMGYVRGLTVSVPRGANREKTQARLGGLLKQPIFMFMREFRVELIGGGRTLNWLDQIRPTSSHHIRTIGFAAINEGADRWTADLDIEYTAFKSVDMDMSQYGGAAQETRGLSGMQRLELTGRFRPLPWSRIGSWIPTQLRELLLESDNFIPGDVAALATWRLPTLERLELIFQSKNSYADADDLARLFAASWPALRVLTIRCNWVDDLIEALLEGPLLRQLTELNVQPSDLSEAQMTSLTERAPNVQLRHGS
jgi:hypothetical protein